MLRLRRIVILTKFSRTVSKDVKHFFPSDKLVKLEFYGSVDTPRSFQTRYIERHRRDHFKGTNFGSVAVAVLEIPEVSIAGAQGWYTP